MNIYVGSLSFRMREDELRRAFEEFGEVNSAKIISDKYSGKSKGFGFVEMPNDAEAKKAIEELNGKEIGGRKIIVNESVERERTERRPSFNRDRDRDGGNRRERRY
jgi:RNA recognition motif-containing protein